MDLRNVNMPSLPGDENSLITQKQYKVLEDQLYSLGKQLEHILLNLGAENFNEQLKDELLNSGEMQAFYTTINDIEGGMGSIRKQTAELISSVVYKDGVISAINQTAEMIQILANKLNLSGYTSINNNFNIDTNGYFHANKGGSIGPFSIDEQGNMMLSGQAVQFNQNGSGTIDAARINVDNLNANNITSGTISANMISGGTISANMISGGVLNGIEVSGINGSFSMLQAADGTVRFEPGYAFIGGIYIGRVAGYNDLSIMPPMHERGNVGAGSQAWSQVVAQYLYSQTGSVGAYSMRKMKENIRPWTRDIIDLFECCEFRMIGADKDQIGLIADDVVEFCPEITREFQDESMDEPILTLAYDRLTIVLIDEVQKLRKRVNELEARTDALEHKLAENGRA